MEAKWINVQVKAVDAETRTMEGMASTQSPDYGGDVVLASAWKASLKQWKKLKSRPKFLAYHKHSTMDGHSPVIGKILEMRITENGLWFKAWFAETELGEEHLYLYSKGAMDAFSVGFMPMEVEHDGEKIAKLLKKNGIEAAEGSVERVITKAHLLEVSCVVVGMNMEALVSASAEDEVVAKMLDKLEEMAGLKVDEGKAVPANEDGEYFPEAETFDFEESEEEVTELGVEEVPEEDVTVTVKVKEDAIFTVLREMVELYKGLNVRFDCLEAGLKHIQGDLAEVKAGQPGEVKTTSAPKDGASSEPIQQIMGDLNRLRPELAKVRRRVGLD